MLCLKCKASVPQGAEYCTNCGAKMPVVTEAVATGEDTYTPITAAEKAEPALKEKPGKPAAPAAQEDLLKPLGVLKYVGMLLLLTIPIANIVFVFRWAFGWGVNKNKRNYGRALILYTVIMAVLTIGFVIMWPDGFLAFWRFVGECVTRLTGGKVTVGV